MNSGMSVEVSRQIALLTVMEIIWRHYWG
jgi:hypothetical protein